MVPNLSPPIFLEQEECCEENSQIDYAYGINRSLMNDDTLNEGSSRAFPRSGLVQNTESAIQSATEEIDFSILLRESLGREYYLKKEIERMKKEEDLMKGKWAADSIVTLNVGGMYYTTTIQTLRQTTMALGEHMLATMFSPDHDFHVLRDDQGRAFIDRDGKYFGLILNYLRNNLDWTKVTLPKGDKTELKTELDYYLLSKLRWYFDGDGRKVKYNEKSVGEGIYTERLFGFSVSPNPNEKLMGTWRARVPEAMRNGRFAFFRKKGDYDCHFIRLADDSIKWIQPQKDGWIEIPVLQGDASLVYDGTYECLKGIREAFAHGYHLTIKNCPFDEFEFEVFTS